MDYLTLVSGLIAFAGLATCVTGVRRLFQRRMARAIGLEFSGVLLLLVSASAFLLASNLHTYQRLVYEQPVAEISFQAQADQQFQATIRSLENGETQQLELSGDEWQLDAQVLTWRGIANLFGLDANYRLYRIAGRYSDIELEKQRPRTVHSLVEQTPMIRDERFDLWRIANRHQDLVRWVDASYGSAVFLPMTDGASYDVAISRTGLIARPANQQARHAVSRWIGL
jgi:hypothetical protein